MRAFQKRATNETMAEAEKNVEKGEFTCNECGKEFTRKDNLGVHLKLHVNKDSVHCPICQKEIKHKRNFATHFIKHNKTKEEAKAELMRLEGN